MQAGATPFFQFYRVRGRYFLAATCVRGWLPGGTVGGCPVVSDTLSGSAVVRAILGRGMGRESGPLLAFCSACRALSQSHLTADEARRRPELSCGSGCGPLAPPGETPAS